MLEVRGATPEEIDPSIVCCGHAFGGRDPQRIERMTDFFSKIHKNDPDFNVNNTRLAKVDGKIVSVIQIFDRQMLAHGVPLRMGGLGSVGTHPDHRGQGYNTLVLQDVVHYMEAERYDISLLFTGINDFYARLGWRTFHHALALQVPLNGALPSVPFGGEIRQIRWEDDLDAVIELHRAFNRDATGPTLRSKAYWEVHHTWRPYSAEQIQVAVEGGEIVAYRRDRGGDTIEELAHLDGRESAAHALIFDFMQKAKEAGKERVRFDGNPSFRRMLEAHGLSVEVERKGSFMFRIVGLETVLTKLMAKASARLKASSVADWRGDVVLESE
ncbi:MAG: GNAT family N-acetyltransferase, partial [Candidatus Poribacteria bacterium]|nr:GNAT family N-acetyltransferase [Candidatus Poribacteria bacterium]